MASRSETEILELLKDIHARLEQVQRPANEVILDDVDLRNMLKVSKRTTASWRQERLVKHYWIKGKCFYKLSDILEAMDRGLVPVRFVELRIRCRS